MREKLLSKYVELTFTFKRHFSAEEPDHSALSTQPPARHVGIVQL